MSAAPFEQKRANLVRNLRELRDIIASVQAYNSRLPSVGASQGVFRYLQQADEAVYRALNEMHVAFPDADQPAPVSTTQTVSGKRRYGAWAGRPQGLPEDAARCAEAVADGMLFKQCGRKRGHGPAGAYCKQHAVHAERRAVESER